MAALYRLKWNGPKVFKKIQAAEVKGLTKSSEHVLGKTRQVVPIDEAALSRSGTASVDKGLRVAAISYDTPYAVVQHEHMDYRHAPGRTAKYVEGPLNAAGPEVLALVAVELRRIMQ